MPNSKGLQLKTEEKDGRIVQIKEPELFAFLPPKEERKPMAIIVIPGGGYYKLTYDLGGYQIAKWFNTLGISAFVLNYRLPISPDVKQREIAPLQDIQAAIKYIRKNADQYGISPEQIGVIGTSAGGHLAATVSNITTDYTELKDDWTSVSTIPNFAILVSPVIDLGEFAHVGSRNSLLGENASQEKIIEYSMQNRVTEKTPPTLLIHAQNDKAVEVEKVFIEGRRHAGLGDVDYRWGGVVGYEAVFHDAPTLVELSKNIFPFNPNLFSNSNHAPPRFRPPSRRSPRAGPRSRQPSRRQRRLAARWPRRTRAAGRRGSRSRRSTALACAARRRNSRTLRAPRRAPGAPRPRRVHPAPR